MPDAEARKIFAAGTAKLRESKLILRASHVALRGSSVRSVLCVDSNAEMRLQLQDLNS
jgi:hypothetical protein